jgi:hypothetical protein
MAEFKLGRIKFVWKGAWTNGTAYYVDDVIRNGGKTFICVAGHTAAGNFYNSGKKCALKMYNGPIFINPLIRAA